jgi:hypothetical protein
MPFNGSGVFQRLYSWVTDRDAGTKIIADRMDAETNGIVSGLNAVVDGTQGFIAPVRGSGGTAAAPGHSFTDDTDSGMYRVSANTLGFSVAGTLEGQFEPGFFNAANGLKIGGTAVTSTAAELNILDGVTATAAELNYVDGVTSAIQTQLDAKEAADADILKADTAGTLTAGFNSTDPDPVTVTTGTFTPDPAIRNFQPIINGGAHTLAPPASSCSIVLQYTNNASAGPLLCPASQK